MLLPTEPRPGIYRHFKGKLYEVLDLARHSESEEWYVIYRPLNAVESGLWIRPMSMFTELVDYHGQKVPRFGRVPDPD